MDERSVDTYTQALMRTPFLMCPEIEFNENVLLSNLPPPIEKSSIVVN